MKDVFKVKCPGLSFSLSGDQNKVQQFHEKQAGPAETAAYALRCVAAAVCKATETARKEYPGLPVVFSGGVAAQPASSKAAINTQIIAFNVFIVPSSFLNWDFPALHPSPVPPETSSSPGVL